MELASIRTKKRRRRSQPYAACIEPNLENDQIFVN